MRKNHPVGQGHYNKSGSCAIVFCLINWTRAIRLSIVMPSHLVPFRVDEIKVGPTACERPKSLQSDRRECNNGGQ